MRRVAIVGGGHTDFVFNSPKTGIELFAEAAMEAIYESNLKPKNIQAIYCGNGLGDFSEGQIMIQSYIANDIGCLNVPATRFEGACASATLAIRDAAMWVASGKYDIVLVGWHMIADTNLRRDLPFLVILPCLHICILRNTIYRLQSSKSRWRWCRFSPMNTARKIRMPSLGRR